MERAWLNGADWITLLGAGIDMMEQMASFCAVTTPRSIDFMIRQDL